MLILKICLVPCFLLLISLAGKRWGPSVAGWLAGLPVVAGPILLFLSLEHGEAFAANAARAALSAVFASVSFSAAYAYAAQRMVWIQSLLIALMMWVIAAFLLSQIHSSTLLSFGISIVTLLIAPKLFPPINVRTGPHLVSKAELACRMFAGALLTLVVTLTAGAVGQAWSGLLAVFPILGIVLAVFSHRTQGLAYAAALLRAMVTGLYSFAFFCVTLSVALQYVRTATSFAIAVFMAIIVQVATKRYLARPNT